MFTPIWTKSEKRSLNLLSFVWLCSAVVFWIWWFQPEHVASIWGMVLTTIVISWPLLMPGFSIFFILKMKRLSSNKIPKNIKVAMIVTKTPSEPLSTVRKTLTAMLSQKYRHDTWVADESPTAEALEWYKNNGVKVSCRKDDPSYHNETWPRRKKSKEGNLAYFYDKYGYNNYDIVVQMDADHVPKDGYLEKMLQPFNDSSIGYVSAPSVCDSNKEISWTARARAQADSTFQGPVQSGSNAGWVPKCIGSHYAVRTIALKEIGGLGPELAEDYSTTLIMNAHGWKGVSAYDAEAQGEGTYSFGDVVIQDYQWARSLTSILLTIFPRYFRKLDWRQRFQFTFTQLWYPISALVWLIAVSLPIIALLKGEGPVRVSFFEFLPFYAVPYMLALSIYIFTLYKGHMRPKSVKFISWEVMLFELARWPWVLIASIDALISSIIKKNHIFKVTSKKRDPHTLPIITLIPYVLIIIGAIIGIAFRNDEQHLFGYYLFVLISALSYLVLLIAVVILHIKEMVGRNKLRLLVPHLPHLVSWLILSAGIILLGFLNNSVDAKQEVLLTQPVSAVKNVYHIVIKDDSLWKIAVKYYNDGYQWIRFEKRKNPDLIFPGESIEIPNITELGELKR